MTHTHGHGHAHAHGHRECSTPPPPPGTVDLEEMKRRAEAEAARRAEIERATGDQGDGIPPVVEVTAENLEAEVVIRSEQVPVVVLVGSPGDPGSARMRTTLETMVRDAGLHWLLGWVDVDAQPAVARAFGIQGIPSVIAVAGGGPIGQFVGEQTRDFLRQWVDQVLEATRGRLRGLPPGTTMAGEGGSGGGEPEPAPVTDDPRLAEAEDRLNEGDFDGAVAVYDAILESEPANTQLKLARTNVAFLARAGRIDQTSDPVGRADAAPGDVGLALDAADVEMLLGEPEASLNRLLGLLPTVFGDDRERVRARLLDLLAMIDPADPVALAARRRMASALF